MLESNDLYITLKHEEDKVIVFEKANLLFAFNFHPSKSFENYRIGTKWSSDHIILFDTDGQELGGNSRLEQGKRQRFVPVKGVWQTRSNSIRVYLPNRSAIVFIAEENITEEAREHGVTMPVLLEPK